ncbi:MAG: hypothetical protein B7733_20330 [Myxococcales bacterium FL481]|nr:MAG: hypothetical protein B7733_20330 [Myxococcales bacterium FL481]
MLVLLLALGTTFPYFEKIRSANELPRLMQGIALVEDGSWSIDGPKRRGLDPGPDTSRGADGRSYPNKPPLTSVLAAVGYIGAKTTADASPTLRACMLWSRLLAGLLPTLVLCAWAWRRYAPREGREAAWLGVLLYAVATPAASYAHLLYAHQLAACLATIGAAWCLDGAELGRWRRAAVGGALAAAAVVAEYQAVVLALPLGLVLLGKLRRPAARMPVCASLVAAIAMMVALAAYHDTAFGSPLATGYHHAETREFAAKHAVGVLGLGLPTWDGVYTHVFSPQHGLLWWVPLCPLAVYGLGQRAVTPGPHRDEARVALGFFLTLLILGCSLSFDGGWRVGPRYLMVAMPALILGWGHAFRQFGASAWRVGLAMFFAVWSALQNSLAASSWPHIDATNIYYPLADVLVPLFRADYQPYSVAWWLGSDLGVPVAVGTSTLAVLVAVLRVGEVGIRTIWLSTVAVLTALYGVALTPSITPEHPKRSRNLRYIRSVYEPTPGPRALAASRPVPPARPGP